MNRDGQRPFGMFENGPGTAPARRRQHAPGQSHGQRRRPFRFAAKQLKQANRQRGRADEPYMQPQAARDERAFGIVLSVRHDCSAVYGAAAAGELRREADFVSFVSRRPRTCIASPHSDALAVRSVVRLPPGEIVRPARGPKEWRESVSPKATILVVDDEPDVREVLEEYFVAHGYAVIAAESASVARAMAAQHPIDLALVDITMPGEDGLSLARHLRERYAKVAIVMLTSAATVVDRIVGLEMGADDYVPKPFDPRELVARVKSVLRRTSSAGRAEIGAEKVRIGRCVLDLAAHRLTDEKGGEVAMSPLEFDLLKALAEHPNRALSRERILNLNQQRDWDPFDRSVDLRIMRLRKKIEPDPERPRFIRTIRNEGYIFVPDGA
jgi:DNA-binding response OmpR family regulator